MTEYKLPLGLERDPGNLHLIGRLEELESYDFGIVRKHVRERLGWDDARVTQAELRTRQFMALSFLDMGQAHVPEQDVDDYWHAMLLHTRWYHAFCSTIFGEYYHHTPEPKDAPLDDARRERSAAAANYWFGERPGFVAISSCVRCSPMFTGKPGLAPMSLNADG